MSKPIEIPEYMLDKYSDMEGKKREGVEDSKQSMAHINEFCKWAVDVFDSQAKEMGYPGTGKVPPQKLADLYAAVAERNLSDALLRQTPEVAAISLTAGILGMNYLAHRKKSVESVNEKGENDE